MTSEPAAPAAPRPPARPGPPVPLNRPLGPGRRRPAGEGPLTHHLRRTMARGFRPPASWDVPVRYLLPGRPQDGTGRPEEAAAALRTPPGRPGIAMVVPTYVTRTGLARQREWFGALLDQAATAARDHPRVPLVLFVGMQWSSAGEETESLRRLRVLLEDARARLPGLRVCGLSLPGPGKPRTLNGAIAVAELLGCAGVGWADDDVVLAEGCLSALVRDFLAAGCRGAVGATKIAHTHTYATSRLLSRAKAIAAPATGYPHGCCLLVATDVVSGGLPGRYLSDDGYVCYRLLDPALPDPLAQLRLVPDARCHYYVAGPAGETRRRIRRLLLNHLVDVADWPLPVVRYYIGHVLFGGMWPLTGFDSSRGVRHGVQKALIKWLYFAWFAGVGGELYARGLLGRPLRGIEWAPYSDIRRLTPSSSSSSPSSPSPSDASGPSSSMPQES
ncbi:hypothetical protein [Streptomyces fumanus]|uniref:hypothetical protein n=2 Tax=Streptomyces fumanus TaxID=67302 RepID=UPI001E2B391D|nr:hypothetical protein [Streptomyces fumanus]